MARGAPEPKPEPKMRPKGECKMDIKLSKGGEISLKSLGDDLISIAISDEYTRNSVLFLTPDEAFSLIEELKKVYLKSRGLGENNESFAEFIQKVIGKDD